MAIQATTAELSYVDTLRFVEAIDQAEPGWSVLSVLNTCVDIEAADCLSDAYTRLGKILRNAKSDSRGVKSWLFRIPEYVPRPVSSSSERLRCNILSANGEIHQLHFYSTSGEKVFLVSFSDWTWPPQRLGGG